MIRWFLVLFAALGLLGLGAGAALVAAPDRVTVVLGADPAQEREAPAPQRDRTDELLAEIASLRDGLVAVGGALDDAARSRDEAQRAAVALSARLAELASRQEAAQARQELRWKSLRATLEAKEPEPVVEPPAPKPVEPPPQPAPVVRERKTLAELLAARKSVDPRDKATVWRLLPRNGRIGFDGSSTVHNFTARSGRVEGAVTLHWNDLSDAAAGEVRLTIATLDSGVEGRDEEIRRHLGEGGHPTVSCRVLALAAKGEERDGVRAAHARLRFTIHGRSREVETPVKLTWTRQHLLRIQGEVKLKMSQFDLHPKPKLGVIKVDDEVTVWWDLYAEPQRAKS